MNAKDIITEDMWQKYKELKTLSRVAEFFNVSRAFVTNRFIKNNLPYDKKNIYSFDKDFFKKDTPESFYVAGFLAADGWLYKKKDGINGLSYIIGLSLKEEDKSHIEAIQKLLKSNHKLHKRVIKNSKRDPLYNDSITYTLQICSKDLFNDIKRFGLLPKKSLTYKMPQQLLDHKYIKYFLLGYFDGDGSI